MTDKEKFCQTVAEMVAIFGGSAGKIADALLEEAYPRSAKASRSEGIFSALKDGVTRKVKGVLKAPPPDDQYAFSDIDPEFLPAVRQLSNGSYFVPTPTGGEHKSVPYLLSGPDKLPELDAARKFQRRKGLETLAEADNLDLLYDVAVEKWSVLEGKPKVTEYEPEE